jgi:hypothetical protein
MFYYLQLVVHLQLGCFSSAAAMLAAAMQQAGCGRNKKRFWVEEGEGRRWVEEGEGRRWVEEGEGRRWVEEGEELASYM